MKQEIEIGDLVEVNDPQVAQVAKLISGHAFKMGRVSELHGDPRFVKVRNSNDRCDPEKAEVWFSRDQVDKVNT